MLGAAEHQRRSTGPVFAGTGQQRRFSAWLTKVTLWSIRSTVVAAG
jgi:hypothetical protein